MTNYLVTTKVADLETVTPIAMVDGTVPGWNAKPGDLHWDHHRAGGGKVQIDEMPMGCAVGSDYTFVTTQLEADAVVAAVWAQLESCTEENYRRLRAIAFDCDYLCVPDDLSDLSEFAAKVVAALKAEGVKLRQQWGSDLPQDMKEWTDEQRRDYYSFSFRHDVNWLLDAVAGKRDWPGENGEADIHFAKIESDKERLLAEKRVTFYRMVPICDQRGLKGYIDPRSFYRCLDRNHSPITLVMRDRKQGDGIGYTLGTFPLHHLANTVDFSAADVWNKLSDAERALNPDFEGWGGRAIVGGSSWNNPSLLTPQQVIDIVLDAPYQLNVA
jgi:hypothetical protein